MLRKPIVTACLVLLALVLILPCAGLAKKPTVVMWLQTSEGTYARAILSLKAEEISAKFKVDFQVEEMNMNSIAARFTEVAINGRGLPDMIDTTTDLNYTGNLWNKVAKKSFLIPLNKWASKSSIFKSLDKSRLPQQMQGANIYGLPEDICPVVLVYNNETWKKAGIDLSTVRTWDEYVSKCKILCADKNGDGKPDHYAFYDEGWIEPTLYLMLQQAGVQFVDKNGNPLITSPAFIDVVKKWAQWMKTVPVATNSSVYLEKALADGTLLAYPANSTYLTYLVDEVKSLYPGLGKGAMRIMPLPAWRPDGPRTGFLHLRFIGVTREAKNPELCYKIAEWLNYSPNAIKARFAKAGVITPLVSTYNNPIFHQANPFFGGQKIGGMQISLFNQVPRMNTDGPYWALEVGIGQNYSGLLSGTSVEQVMDKALEYMGYTYH